jgi:UDP-2,4-diacetamido-2,4,6-trideoxy-beta-L-altropyranose hydrolase
MMSVATETPPSVAIRVDGGTQMGSGHVMRCLTLAGELVRNGARVTFICRELPGYLGGLIERAGHPVVRLRAPAAEHHVSNSNWLQVPWLQDCEETREVLKGLRAQWLVVDHYGIGADWERALRREIGHILVIDDLADRPHDCDALLDQNYFGDHTGRRYGGLVPPHCRLLLGPRYAILQREYANLHSAMVPRVGDPRRVFVFFGGSDTTDETSKALRALEAPQLAHLAVDIVLGANHPASQAVATLVARRPGTTLHGDLPSLAGLMFRADLAVGAGGITTSERLCMGLPSIVITLAPNQEGPISSLAEEGAVIWAGRAALVSVAELVAAIVHAVNTRSAVPRMVDGRGAVRISAAILPPAPAKLYLRRATLNDARLLFDWRNESLVREMSYDDSPIKWDAHLRWFKTKLADREAEIYIGDIEGLPVGQVRLDFHGDEAAVSYSVDSDMRGLGFGKALIEKAVRASHRVPANGFRAQVKAENAASKKVFQRLGWRETIVEAEYVFWSDGADGRSRHPPDGTSR